MPLPVIQADPLEAALVSLVKGQVRFSRHDRLLYSTDASLYQVEPLGVVVPADAEDVSAVLQFCDERKVAVLPRGGGTSLAGQGTNRAIVLDLSAMQRRVLDVDVARRECVVQPGISVDELNRHLKSVSLFFAPDPATSAQCAIGGCLGNNTPRPPAPGGSAPAEAGARGTAAAPPA